MADVNTRVSELQRRGYSFLPTQTLYTLADSGMTDSEIVHAAEGMRRAAVGSTRAAALRKPVAQSHVRETAATENIANQQYLQSVRSSGLYSKEQIAQIEKTTAAAHAPAQKTQQAVAQDQKAGASAYKVFFEDPVLQKHPSAALALKQYLSGAIGTWPIENKDVGLTQTQLQVQGFGRDLKADGTWNEGWSAAQNQWKDHVYNSQLAGNKPGGMTTAHALEALSALTPTSAWNALVGYAMALPDGARQLLGDVAGGTAQFGVDLYHGAPGGSEAGQSAGYNVNASVVNALGGDTSAKQVRKGFEENGGLRLLEDVSNIIMLTSVMGSAGKFANAVGIERTARAGGTAAEAALTLDEAQQGPGVVARSLASAASQRGPGTIAKALSSEVGGPGIVPRAIVGGVLGGATATAAGGTPAEIALATAGGAAVGGFSNTKVFRSIPVLGNTGPMIDRLAGTVGESGAFTAGDSLYYKVRNMVAAPYKLSAVRLADTGFQQSLMLGAEARGLAQVQDWAAGDQQTQLSKSVETEHVMDTVNDAIKHRLGFTVLGQHIAPSLDDLMFLFSGRGAAALHHAPSEAVGSVVTNAVHGATEALVEPGFVSAIERATETPFRTLVKQAGGLPRWNRFWSNKVADMAAYWGAEQRRTLELIETTGSATEGLSMRERIGLLRQYSHEIRNDPDQLKTAVAGMRAQSGGDELVVRIKREMLNTRMGRKGHEQDIQALLDADEHVTKHLLPWADVPIPGVVETGVEGNEAAKAANRALGNTTGEIGTMGIASNDTFVQQTANEKVRRLRDEANAIADKHANALETVGAARADRAHTPQTLTEAETAFSKQSGEVDRAVHEWHQKTNKLLHDELGLNVHDIAAQSMDEKLALIEDWKQHLAVRVDVHPDAPAHLHDAVAKLNDMGYQLVTGTDIGFRLHGAAIPEELAYSKAAVEADKLSRANPLVRHGPSTLNAMGEPLSFQRKLAEHLGLNPTMIPDATIAQHRIIGILNEIQKQVEKGNIKLPPLTDPTTIVAYLKKEGIVNTSSRTKKAIRNIFNVPERLAKNAGLGTTPEAVESVREELDMALQLRDLSRKRVVDALMNGELWGKYAGPSAEAMTETRTAAELGRVSKEGLRGGRIGKMDAAAIPPMSRESAEAVYHAIVVGSATPKAYMLGASRLEDLGRAKLGLGGLGMKNDLGYAMANLPNKLVQVRNEMRFDLSPYFSFRRISKVNAKLGVEGVTPVLEPLKVMTRRGTREFDRVTLERIEPQLFHRQAEEAADSAGRYLESQDVFGFYNSRNFEAYAAGEWARQGFSDDEIRAKLIKVFEYGTGGTAGRTAIERSTNFFFFPWSFDKTLYRNIGQYLLDKPAQRYLITSGIAAYAQFNEDHMDGKNPLATSWWEKHVPVIKEAERLNAFSHGLSIGEPGGINRPLLNLFLPQSWAPTTANSQVLYRFVPAIKDLQRVRGELQDQTDILRAAKENVFEKNAPTYAEPGKSTLSHQEQIEAGYAMQQTWDADFKKYTDANASTTDQDEKYRFPLKPKWGKYGGEIITRANIKKIVHEKYPAYDPNAGQEHAIESAGEFQDYLLDLKGDPRHPDPMYDYVSQFAKAAGEFTRYASEDKYEPAQKRQLTEKLRAAAIWIAERDPKFYKLYDKNFGYSLGPLEAVK